METFGTFSGAASLYSLSSMHTFVVPQLDVFCFADVLCAASFTYLLWTPDTNDTVVTSATRFQELGSTTLLDARNLYLARSAIRRSPRGAEDQFLTKIAGLASTVRWRLS